MFTTGKSIMKNLALGAYAGKMFERVFSGISGNNLNLKPLRGQENHHESGPERSTATTGGHLQTALSNAPRIPRLRSLLTENAHPVKR